MDHTATGNLVSETCPIEGVEMVFTSRADALLPLVRAFHASFIVPTFSGNEVEPVAMWEERLQDQLKLGPLTLRAASTGEAHDYEFGLALLVRKSDKAVMGAAVHEVYVNACSALISYMVVSSEMRGKGAARHLVDGVFLNSERVLEAVLGPAAHLDAVFIEVMQVRDDHDDEDAGAADDPRNPCPLTSPVVQSTKFRSKDRQVIFGRLGFLPVDLNFVHPGVMKGHRYNIALATRSMDIAAGVVPCAVVLRFLEGLVMGILADEGSTDRTEMTQWRELLHEGAPDATIGIGPQFWR